MQDTVEITVHRGCHQIGGCATTIRYKSSQIAIDLGKPIMTKGEKDLAILGLTEGKKQYEAIFLTHYHEDHIGEADNVLPQIPIYIGACAKEIIFSYQRRMGLRSPYHFFQKQMRTIEAKTPLVVGDFKVTAIPSDHSSIDSFMYLVEVGGKKILHTGDFRLHGLRKQKLLETIRQIKNVDLLITEGTVLSRKPSNDWQEEQLGKEFKKVFSSYKYCFVLASSTNLDRIQILSENVPKEKYFIVSSFQHKLMKIAEKHGFCQFSKAQKYRWLFSRKLKQRGFTMVIGTSARKRKLIEYYLEKYPKETCLVYSMWSGYKERDNIKKLCQMAGDNLYDIHASGHVTLQDLNSFIENVNPKKIIVIHTENEDKSSLCYHERILKVRDGERVKV